MWTGVLGREEEEPAWDSGEMGRRRKPKGGNAFQTARAHAPSLSRGTRGEASAGILLAAGPGPGGRR